MQLLGYREGNNLHLVTSLVKATPKYSTQLHISVKWIALWASYLQEPKLVQETAQVSDDLRPSNKFLPHWVVQNQVQVALTETGFLLGQIHSGRYIKTNILLEAIN